MISSNWRTEQMEERENMLYTRSCFSIFIQRLASELILDCYFACARCTPRHSALWGQFPPDPHSRLPNHVFVEVNSTTPTQEFRAKYLFISVPLVLAEHSRYKNFIMPLSRAVPLIEGSPFPLLFSPLFRFSLISCHIKNVATD